MLLTITFLIVAWLQPAQPTVVTQLHPTELKVAELHYTHGQEMPLYQPKLTVVQTWPQ